MRWLLAALLLAVPAGAHAGEDDEPGVVEHDTVQIAPSAGVRIRAVEIDNRLGDVVVVGRDAPELSLTVVKRAPDGETLERLKVNLLPDPSGTVRIGTALLFGEEGRPIAAGSVRIDISVSVPRDAHVDVKAWNGNLAVTGTRRGATLAANEGDVMVTDVRGTVASVVRRGKQRIAAVDGAVTAGNTFGDLSLDEIRGDSLAATVHRGSVQATRVRSRKVTIRTTFGRIYFEGELVAGGRYDVRSYRGDVEVRFPRGATLKIDAYSRQGGVEPQVELAEAGRPEAGRLTGTFGPARPKPAILELTSVAGTVTFGLVNE